MPIRSAVISVGSNAKALGSNARVDAAARITVYNMGGAGSGLVFLGDSQVTVASGLPLASNATPLTVNTGGAGLYAVSQEQSQAVRIIEEL